MRTKIGLYGVQDLWDGFKLEAGVLEFQQLLCCLYNITEIGLPVLLSPLVLHPASNGNGRTLYLPLLAEIIAVLAFDAWLCKACRCCTWEPELSCLPVMQLSVLKRLCARPIMISLQYTKIFEISPLQCICFWAICSNPALNAQGEYSSPISILSELNL